MKKTLSLFLAILMVLSVCSSLIVVADDRENLAAGKSYEISEQFRMGGADVGWGYDENAAPSYPDDGGELTDGEVPASDEGYSAAGWVGFNKQTPAQAERGYAYVILDLEAVSDITGVSVAYCKDTGVGITVPYWVEYHVSEDGESYKQMGYSEINPDSAPAGTNWYGIDFEASARFVMLKVYSYGWAFLGEIEVYGTGSAPVEPEPEEPAAEEHTIAVSHVNLYSWGAFNAFVITEVGKNCTNNSNFQYPCDWWYAIKVDGDVVTAIEAPGTAKTAVVEEGGFILYVYSNDAEGWDAASKVEVGDVLLENTVDLSTNVASETPVGYMTFGPKQATEPVEPEDPPVEEPDQAPVSVEVLDGSVKVPADDVLAKLVDGNLALDATAFGDAGLVAFQNTGFEHGVEDAVPATIAITVDLGEMKTISKASLSAYKESNSMIALPSVKFEISVDGVNFYDINAGGIVSPKDDLAESATATLTADFSTRIAANARYVRVIASFTNGWVFLSEISVTLNETHTGMNPDNAFPYADKVSGTAVGVYDAEDGELDLAALFKNSQLIKAVYDEAAGAYKVIYSKVNPWPAGHSGTETLGEGEILVAINTGGTLVAETDDDAITTNLFSGCKWIARGLTEGDYLVFREGTVAFYPAEGAFEAGECVTKTEEPVDPPVDPEPPVVVEPVEGEGNLALDRGWYGDTNSGSGYVGDVTDGVIDPEGKYDTTLWYGFDQRKIDDGVASMIIDLGTLYGNIQNVQAYVWPAGYSGIAIPTSITFYASEDGEEFVELGVITAFDGTSPQWIGIDFDDLLTARYIKMDIAGTQDTGVFWFVGEIEVNAKAAEVPPVDPPVEEPKTWEDTYVVLENGNAQVDIPYGYTWTIDDIDGKIGGEDTTLITNQDAYNACNPNWAITLYLEKQEDGSYIALRNAIVTPGSADGAGITLSENQVAFVIHSSSSNPDGGYDNWLAKVVAMSVKEGDRFIVDTENMTVYAVIPGEDYVVPEEPVEPEIPSISDFDGDGVIAESDAELMLANLVGTDATLADADLDLDGNGAFDIYDVVLALQYVESLAK